MNITILEYFGKCFSLPNINYQAIAFNLINVPFILPVCVYVLCLGLQRYRSRSQISHSDFFTYNMALIQLIGILGSCLLTGNMSFGNPTITVTGIFMLLINSTAVVTFQVITCLERYIAVVYPVTYLNMKSQTWAVIRNLSCALVWVQCIVESLFCHHSKTFVGFFIQSVIQLSSGIFIIMFCNLRILYVLMRPGPGEGAKISQSKQKTLNMILFITGALLMKFGGDLISVFSFLFLADDTFEKSCGMFFSMMWFSLPSTLVLPLLFLHRNGKLQCNRIKKANVLNNITK